MTPRPVQPDATPDAVDDPEPIRSRAECIADAGAWFADALDQHDARTPREAAELSVAVAAGTHTVDEVEDMVRLERGLDPIHQPEQSGGKRSKGRAA